MTNEEIEDLKKTYPYTETLTAVSGDWVVPELWWDEDEMIWGVELHPVAAWIHRAGIHENIDDYVRPFAALISTYDFGLTAHDDDLFDDADFQSPMLRSAVKQFEREWAVDVARRTGKTGWKRYEDKSKAGDKVA